MSRQTNLWRHSNFLRFWGAQSVSLMGTQVSALALPAVAILVLRATPFEVGILAGLPWVAFLVLGLPAGALADRLSKRRIMILSDGLRALALGAIPLTFFLGVLSLPILYIAGALVGLGNVFFEISSAAYLPVLLQSEALVEGNSKLSLSEGASLVGGPALGGLLIGVVGGAFAILADVFSYVFSGILLSLVRTHEPLVRGQSKLSLRQMGSDIREGLIFLWHSPTIFTISIVSTIQNLGDSMGQVLLLVLLYQTLHLEPSLIGLAFTLGSVGFILGAISAKFLTIRLGIGRLMFISSCSGAISFLLLPLAVLGFPLLWVILTRFLYGLHIPTYNITSASLRQAIVPPEIQGRLNAATRTLGLGVLSIGPVLGGALAATWGPASVIFLSGIIFLLGSLPLLLHTVSDYRVLPQQPTFQH
jgi:MFS family permease